jgi:hypothetical protein
MAGFMNTARPSPIVAQLDDGDVLIAGGTPGGLATAERFDPDSGEFSATGRMGMPRVGSTSTVLLDGRVLIAGGFTAAPGGGQATDYAELFDPLTNAFAATGPMMSTRDSHTATMLPDGRVLIAGGWNGRRADATDDPPWNPLFVELFDPRSGVFSMGRDMSTTRIGHRAVRLVSGRVLLLGGVPAIQNRHEQPPNPAYAEIFDPASGAISPLTTPSAARQEYTATALPNGMVLMLGGKIDGRAVATAELFNPATGAVTSAPGLAVARFGHAALLMPDGRVLVIGGTGDDGKLLSAVEYWAGTY